MGFPAGTTVTVDNALKMLMVKSANDIAVVIAEGVGGSVEGFADQMNRHAQRLGMTQSHWVNPHGLPADEQITSARDMAILARAVLREFPEYDYLLEPARHPHAASGLSQPQQPDRPLRRHRRDEDRLHLRLRLQRGGDRDPRRQAADRGGARLAVAGGARGQGRAVVRARLPGAAAVLADAGARHRRRVAAVNVDPPNLRDEMCGKNRRRQPSEEAENEPLAECRGRFALCGVPVDAARRRPAEAAPLLQDVPPRRAGAGLHRAGERSKPATRAAEAEAARPAKARRKGEVGARAAAPGRGDDPAPRHSRQAAAADGRCRSKPAPR